MVCFRENRNKCEEYLPKSIPGHYFPTNITTATMIVAIPHTV